MAQYSHCGVYLCQHAETPGDEERADGVKLDKDAPEDWHRAANASKLYFLTAFAFLHVLVISQRYNVDFTLLTY